MTTTYIHERFLESVEVLDTEGEIEGYALIQIPSTRRIPNSVPLGDPRILTSVRCCRTCAWSHCQHPESIAKHGIVQ